MFTRNASVHRVLGIFLSIALLLILFASPGVSAEEDKNQALIEAGKEGRVEDVKRLLDSGADVNGRDKDGATALMWAAAECRFTW